MTQLVRPRRNCGTDDPAERPKRVYRLDCIPERFCSRRYRKDDRSDWYFMLPQLLAAALVEFVRSLSGCSLVQKLCIDALKSLGPEPLVVISIERWLVIDSAMSFFVYKYGKLLNPGSQDPGVIPREVAAGC